METETRVSKAGERGPGWLDRIVKLAALGAGLPLSVLAATAIVGLWVDTLWIGAAVALAVVVVVPLLVADRLLPKDTTRTSRGFVTDVMAFAWMGATTIAVALAPTAMQGAWLRQADRLAAHGWTRTASLARRVAGGPGAAASLPPEPATPEPATPVAVDPAPAKAEADPKSRISSPDSPPGATETGDEPPAKDPSTADKPAAERKALSPAELFQAWAPSVVTITARNPYGFGGAGTGFVVGDDGLIATNHHVIDEATEIEVKLLSGTVLEKAKVVIDDPALDLALLEVKVEDGEKLPPVLLGASADVTVGEAVIVIGNPLGLEHTLSDGLLSSRRVYEGKRYIQMTAPVSPGNSGGPVFNRFGEVIGVTVAKIGMHAGENLNLAVPVDHLRPLLQAPRDGRRRGSSW